MPTIATSADFLNDDGRYGQASLQQVIDALVGQQIAGVEKAGFNSITFQFVSGASMTLTSSGFEGDDLALVIETN